MNFKIPTDQKSDIARHKKVFGDLIPSRDLLNL
jgi:hypothetical protein